MEFDTPKSGIVDSNSKKERRYDFYTFSPVNIISSFNNHPTLETEFQHLRTGGDGRFVFSRHSSFRQFDVHTPVSIISNEPLPLLSRSFSSLCSVATPFENSESSWKGKVAFDDKSYFNRKVQSSPPAKKISFASFMLSVFPNILRSGSRPMKRLLVMILLNVTYSTAEFLIGLFTGRIGLVSDAFHLTFGCGLLTFSLFAMAASRNKPDGFYTYGYKRLEVLSAFSNAIFLLFMSFSLAVEALHAFIQDEDDHKHYLIVSAVTNLLVNLLGVWFFRSYARINIVYRKAEDMNCHSVVLHVLADSIQSAGLILASWFLTLGVKNAEVLCLGLVSVVMFILIMPLFRATGGVLLQMAPSSIPTSAITKCWRQITSLGDVLDVSQARFWELVPGHVVGSLLIQVKKGADDHPILRHVHALYQDIGVQDLTVQTEFV